MDSGSLASSSEFGTINITGNFAMTPKLVSVYTGRSCILGCGACFLVIRSWKRPAVRDVAELTTRELGPQPFILCNADVNEEMAVGILSRAIGSGHTGEVRDEIENAWNALGLGASSPADHGWSPIPHMNIV